MTAVPPSSPAPNLRPRAIASHVSGVAAATVVLIGLAVLAGWTFDVEILKGLIPGLIIMIPNTAVLFVLAGIALWLKRADHRRSAPVARGLAAIVLVVGFATFIERVTGWNFGIDLLLFPDKVRSYPYLPPGRIATNSTVCFTLAGFALLAMDVRDRRARNAAQIAAATGVLIGLLALTGYLYGARPLYAIRSCGGDGTAHRDCDDDAAYGHPVRAPAARHHLAARE